MTCVAGVNIPSHGHTVTDPTAVYDIGRSHAQKVYEATGTPTDKKVKDLMDPDQDALCKEVEKLLVESDPHRETTINIKCLMDPSCYRGVRHRKGLPMCGQRIRINARTHEGPCKAGVVLKK